MPKQKQTPLGINEYISTFPIDVQSILQRVRAVIGKAAPKAYEAMSYGVPAFKLNGKNLVLFAAFKKHISLYPEPSAISAFKDELVNYETAKGTIKFPLDKPIPYDLVIKIVKYRVQENMGKTETKKNDQGSLQSRKVTERINAKALELLEQHPEGLRFSELRSKIEASDGSFHPKTVNGCVWKLVRKFPDKVYKPSRGIFRLMKYKSAEEDKFFD